MSELAERARALAKALVDVGSNPGFRLVVIEQALLAERRLAMELAESVITDKINDSARAQWSLTNGGLHEFAAEWDTPLAMLRNIRRDLRTAAEKEVGTE